MTVSLPKSSAMTLGQVQQIGRGMRKVAPFTTYRHPHGGIVADFRNYSTFKDAYRKMTAAFPEVEFRILADNGKNYHDRLYIVNDEEVTYFKLIANNLKQ